MSEDKKNKPVPEYNQVKPEDDNLVAKAKEAAQKKEAKD